MDINIYCDESCHLLHDHIPIMTLGAIQYPQDRTRELSIKVSSLKDKYNCRGELKWTKVSGKNLPFYLALIDLFLEEVDLHFRSLIVHQKDALDHDKFNEGEHDNFYYKMYYELLRNIIENKTEDSFKIYLDIKDTRSSIKIHKLREVLRNKFYDTEMRKVANIQQIHSHESNLLQLCDFLLGAVTYANRTPQDSKSKFQISRMLEQRIGYSLKSSTPPWEEKFNLFHFSPRSGD